MVGFQHHSRIFNLTGNSAKTLGVVKMNAATSATEYAGDIPLSLAISAYGGVSMSPDKRGQSAKSEYAQSMAGDYEKLHAQAVKGGTLELLPDVFDRYRARQASTYKAYLSSSSRCVSSFIAGPANFPAARMNKRNDITHKRLTEYLDGGKMALQAAIRTLRPDLRAIMSGDANAIDRLTVKIDAAERAQNQMKAANKAIRTNAKAGEARQVAALMELGFSEAQAVELLHPQFTYQGQGFASYSLTNNNANIRRMKERLEQISKAQATEVQAVECANGVTLEDDAPANRVRLYFPGKPSEEIRTELKSSGFRWSPSVGAWQAYRNNRTLATAKRMAGEPVADEDSAAPEAEIVPAVEVIPTAMEFLSESAPTVTEFLPEKPPIEYTISEARYCKDKIVVNTPSPDGYKTRAARLAGTFGRYSMRSGGYVMSKGQAIKFARLYRNGWDASIMGEGAKSREAPKPAEVSATVKYFDDNEKEVSREEFYSLDVPISQPVPQCQQIKSKSGNWNAEFYIRDDGFFCMRFYGGTWDDMERAYQTTEKRMQALQAMAQAVDVAPVAVSSEPAKPKIAEIRKVIEFCDWVRNDLGGATVNEFKAMDVPGRLSPHIEAVKALVIPSRYARDIERQAWAIECAQKAITRWQERQ